MSSTLSSLLLGKSKDLDNELDSLFKSARRRQRFCELKEGFKGGEEGKKAALQEDEDKDAAQVEEQARQRLPSPEERGRREGWEDDTLVHEALRSEKARSRLGRQNKRLCRRIETPEQRDKRTIFVGNLPLSVAQKRKATQRHILSLVPTAKSESVRFRRFPSRHLPPTPRRRRIGETQSPSQNIPSPGNTILSVPLLGEHREVETRMKRRSRRTTRPTSLPTKEEDCVINQDFHNTADAVNAYIVFSHPPDTPTRAANLPPLPPTLDPYEAAKLAVETCNNTCLWRGLIRVDRVGKIGAKGASQSTEDDDAQGDARPLQDADPKLSIFVGNLDFESKEEDLRVFFEALLEAEKGKPPGESEKVTVNGSVIDKPRTWVTHVRIVRDKDTQLGKGFAYVQFIDKDCVDEVLAMEPVKVKFAKRKLRVQRCKSVPGTSLKIKTAPPPSKKDASSSSQPRLPRPAPVEVPKGDPRLGEKLAGLSKEVRKEVKSKDADRVARRLAKKKARMAIGSKPAGALQGRDRDRSRKVGAGKSSINPGKKMGKPRVRSEKEYGGSGMEKKT
ncbi:hypothetical protein BKA70DRAFT_1536211 [Coprinopsis sp. MPI-PUGE-AT-0042]|nr:hypothetical protein BKA70DRAFT_1536211 [Coprinopsis sp. MPI-PUGE-AT-0042]